MWALGTFNTLGAPHYRNPSKTWILANPSIKAKNSLLNYAIIPTYFALSFQNFIAKTSHQNLFQYNPPIMIGE